MDLKKNVLVLGGSTFMGRSLMEKLSKHDDYNVHYINRGKSYWNNEIKSYLHTLFDSNYVTLL